MTTTTARETATGDADGGLLLDDEPIDPRAPWFGRVITATVLVAGIHRQQPVPIYLVALTLVLAVASRWQFDLYTLLWRRGVAPIVGQPRARVSAAPHRFAQFVAAVVTTGASVALLLDASLLGYSLAGLVAVLSGLAVVTGFCPGCLLYRQLSSLRGQDRR